MVTACVSGGAGVGKGPELVRRSRQSIEALLGEQERSEE